MANPTTIPQLATVSSGDNANIWQPSARDGVPNMLFGRSIYFTEYLPTLGDANDIILCDWSEYLESIPPGGTRADESVHVRYLNNERTFRFILHSDGRGWWRSVLTPKNGDTLSPFVGLAERA